MSVLLLSKFIALPYMILQLANLLINLESDCDYSQKNERNDKTKETLTLNFLQFYVHDEGGFFPEECLVDCSGDQFSENGELVVDSIDDAISGWCQAMGIEQGDRSQDDMVKFINDYEYDDEDTYYYIHPFTFD